MSKKINWYTRIKDETNNQFTLIKNDGRKSNIIRHSCGWNFEIKNLNVFLRTPSCPVCDGSNKSLNLEVIREKLNRKFPDLYYDWKETLIKEEPKHGTLEEAAERYSEGWGENDDVISFIAGAKWQAERMYSEEEVYRKLHNLMTDIKLYGVVINDDIDLKKWFEQFKKKQS